jgi:hypothetical protein
LHPQDVPGAAGREHDAVPALRGGAGWQWPYAPPESWPALIALALLLVVYVSGALLLTRRGKVWPVLAWAVTGGAGCWPWPALIALALLLVVYVIGALLLTGKSGPYWPGQ